MFGGPWDRLYTLVGCPDWRDWVFSPRVSGMVQPGPGRQNRGGEEGGRGRGNLGGELRRVVLGLRGKHSGADDRVCGGWVPGRGAQHHGRQS